MIVSSDLRREVEPHWQQYIIWKKNEKIYVEMDEYGVPCSKEGTTLGSFIETIVVNGKYAPLNILRWDHKDFKVFHDDILQLV